ncbi:IS4 family transposase [Acidovorax sp. KKS102]|nr:IS4 family transposase [Acidovorax sp. KKS102]
MARTAQALRQLAHDLHAYEPLDQSRRPGSHVRGVTARAGRAHQDRGGLAGLHKHQGPSRRHGGTKKNGPQAIGKSRGGWNTKIHMVAADARTAVTFCLSPGQAHDAPEGRRLLSSLGPTSRPVHLLMDRAYEGNETRQLALDLGFIPVVPPMRTRIEPWEYDREMYKRRNEVERLFRRLKGYRRIFSRFEKLDLMFLGFISFVLVADGLRMC